VAAAQSSSSEGRADPSNPLLAWEGDLPPLATVRPDHAREAVQKRLQQGEATLAALEAKLAAAVKTSGTPVAYEDVVLPLEDLYDFVGRPWDMVLHVKSVRDSPELRAAVDELQPKVVSFWQTVSQSAPIFEAMSRLQASSAFAALPEARRRIVERELLDRKSGGVGLSGDAAKEFNKISHQLSELSTTFGNNALDARKAWNLTIHDRARLQGVPERTLAAAVEAAKHSGHGNATAERGPWLLTLDATMLGPVITYAEDRSLRESMFRASATLASSGPSNNTGTIQEILALRQRKAELLGYKSYSDLSFADKMATKEEVHRLLQDLLATGKPAAQQDELELQAFAKENFHHKEMRPWDRPFFVQKLQKHRYGIDAEALRSYFAYPKVLEGLFVLCHRLFNVRVEPVAPGQASMEAAKWHPTVQLFRVSRGGDVAGHILIDPYVRPSEKRAGAWVQPLLPRRSAGGKVSRPVAVVVLNLPAPPSDGQKPALLSLGEVSTLFHEFGHALQHVLTLQNESAVSGLNGIEWDAVEVASQFMEYWPEEDKRTLYSIAQHYSTGQPLPEETYEQLQKAQGFRAGSALTGQIYLGIVDLRLHESYTKGEDPNAIQKAVAKDILAVQPLPEARPLCTFSHIFAGGYASGYYSYQWSKVLSADAFSAFDEGSGLNDEGRVRKVGLRFASTLLAMGGGRSPAKVFADFRGRAPSASALLRYSGLEGQQVAVK